ncbi:MAG: carboxypeptidase-like regulatory domain-containing protein [Bryobacterales bacterium]
MLASAAFLSTSGLHAQSDCILVEVVDPSGRPIAWAKVRSGDVTAETSAEGQASLCGGTNTVEVTQEGFAPAERTVTPGQPLHVRMSIHPVENAGWW